MTSPPRPMDYETTPLGVRRAPRRPSLSSFFSSFTGSPPSNSSPPSPPRAPPTSPPSFPSSSTSELESDEEYAERERNQHETKHHTRPARTKWTDRITLRLLNNGSVARDHLALERTFLAYVRTSLALAGSGVAMMQFLKVGDNTKTYAAPMGASAISAGILVLLIGSARFFQVQTSLPRGYIPVTRLAVAFIAFVVGSLMAAAFAIVLLPRVLPAKKV
ncbi:hypothetical protein BDQ12DRAFT_662 [Crucibulum laeve]|uniref:DUF202 domain-containing protein n=1 Tax=Crucibulum laeve TaxID=68775 RepID=A0A5C3MFL3_9AGAR|nr:hypothetical protein BDQ12DRAFT_662 [Crucibulum laeve]